MKRYVSLGLVILLMVGTLLGCTPSTEDSTSTVAEIDMTGMPEIELANKEVTIYFWSSSLHTRDPEKPWEGYRFEDKYGGNVKIVQSTGDYYENLFKLIAANDVPDIVYAHSDTFPSFIMRGIVQPWDDYVYYEDPVWESTGRKEAIDAMRWDGKIYNMTASFHSLGVLFYNKRIISDAGLEDPRLLQQRGEWTFEAFKEYLEETTICTNGDGFPEIYGLASSSDMIAAFLLSSGEDYLTFTGNGFTNNIKSEKIRESANFLYSLGQSGSNVVTTTAANDAFKNGQAAFVYANDWRGYVDFKRLWQTDGLGIVPVPQHPTADQQYQTVLADYMYLLKGAENPEGAGVYMLSLAYDELLNHDPAYDNEKEETVASYIANGFTEEAASDLYDLFQLPTTLLVSRSVDSDFLNQVYQQPWLTIADTVSGTLDQQIKEATTPLAP